MKTKCLNGVELLKSLSVEEVESRLAELKAEQDALRTVLRSVKARERARLRKQKLAGGVI
jgi:ribosomal protein L29